MAEEADISDETVNKGILNKIRHRAVFPKLKSKEKEIHPFIQSLVELKTIRTFKRMSLKSLTDLELYQQFLM